jgi:hypothetical protein
VEPSLFVPVPTLEAVLVKSRSVFELSIFILYLGFFMSDPSPNPDLECVPIPLRQKVPVPVPHHCSLRTSFHYLLTGTCRLQRSLPWPNESLLSGNIFYPGVVSPETSALYASPVPYSSDCYQQHIHIYVVILQALQSALRGDSENMSCWEALADAYMARSVLPPLPQCRNIFYANAEFFLFIKEHGPKT